jgi:AraC-like DNA-binding protein
MLRFDPRSDARSDGAALKRWREDIARAVLNLDFKPQDGAPFQATIEQILDGQKVRVVRWRHTPAVTLRDAEMVKRGEASYSFVIPISGLLNVRHLGREVQLRPGEGLLLHNNEPGSIGSLKNCDFIAVLLDEHLLPQPDSLRSLGRVVRRTSQGMELMKKYIHCLGTRSDRLTPSLAAAASRHVAELAALALQDGQPDGPADSIVCARDLRLNIALQFIAENYRNPDLDEHLVASQQGISVRHLQRIFEQGGLRFSRLVAERRLAAAHIALTDPAQANRRIADIAFASGFSDISHFNRVFRHAYDTSPSAIRSRRS